MKCCKVNSSETDITDCPFCVGQKIYRSGSFVGVVKKVDLMPTTAYVGGREASYFFANLSSFEWVDSDDLNQGIITWGSKGRKKGLVKFKKYEQQTSDGATNPS